MKCFLQKGFYTIGALKSNRIIYPMGIRQQASEFALHLRKNDPNISLVTVDKRKFYVYRYEGNLHPQHPIFCGLQLPALHLHRKNCPACLYSSKYCPGRLLQMLSVPVAWSAEARRFFLSPQLPQDSYDERVLLNSTYFFLSVSHNAFLWFRVIMGGYVYNNRPKDGLDKKRIMFCLEYVSDF